MTTWSLFPSLAKVSRKPSVKIKDPSLGNMVDFARACKTVTKTICENKEPAMTTWSHFPEPVKLWRKASMKIKLGSLDNMVSVSRAGKTATKRICENKGPQL